MMTTPVTKLTKILDLEAEKYRDQAVVGGLASYVPTWTQEARRAFGPEAGDWIDEIAGRLRTYSALPDTAARREALVTLRDVLNRGPARAEPALEQAPKPAVRPSEPSPPLRQPPDLESPITTVRGIGPKRSQRLERLGVHTIRDLLYFLPRRYDDYSQLLPINRLKYGEEVTIIARVKKAYTRDTRGGRSIFKAILTDGTGSVEVTWFNQPYLANQIKPGQQIVVSGEVDEYLGRLCFTSPQWEPLREELLHTNRIVPVYPLTEGLTARSLRRLMKRVVTYWSRLLPDYLPRSVVRAEGLLDLETAILQAHFPSSQELLKRARQRLAFDELFVLQIALLRQRHEWRSEPGQPIPVREDVLQSFVHSLPYELTEAQQRSLEQIVEDLRSDRPMTRLLQGDVGSGKTVVAAAAMALTASAGSQAAMMAPTEILAEQHYRTVTSLLDETLGDDIQVRLLTGSVTGEDRDQIYAGLENGTVGVVVGTHALIQESVTFDRLALAVVDEQHRFGVRQRGALRQKGYNPHLLVMTATPIPRSLQLTVWGHLDVSVIDQMPPGRKPVVTRLILPTERERAYAFVRSQIEKGRQAFIICPLVEESDRLEAKAAVEEYERLQQDIFPHLELGLLHGRMTGEEKESTMARFARGELDILVATSVIEVGIDVPNASVMLVEGTERFGLAQLHQFRGRVGRGEHASYCLLISDSSSEQAQERLKAVEETNDGFALARKDLEMRGPGEFLGTQQSGFAQAVLAMELARIADLRLVERAREAARRFFETDPELADPAHRLLARRVDRILEQGGQIN
ncbi:MAG: ATP-dependent DNA helicase RecG [Chloroflexota bacterium]|nr:ATP-dependent DNA helicase RecG [Chloroflexota bacterium]